MFTVPTTNLILIRHLLFPMNRFICFLLLALTAPTASAQPVSPTNELIVVQAESGKFAGIIDRHSCWNFIAQTQALHSGFTGEGYVDSNNEIGSYIEITFNSKAAGPQQLGLRCVHVKDDLRTAEVRVNGQVANPTLDFPRTGDWTAWTNISTPVLLRAGPNVIRLTALTTNGLVNLDRFEIAAEAK